MVGAQRIALRARAQRLSIEHLRRYRAESKSFEIFKDMVDGFAHKDPLRLSKYLDIPWEIYGQRWGKLSSVSKISSLRGAKGTSTATPMNADERDAYEAVHRRLEGDRGQPASRKRAIKTDDLSRAKPVATDSRTQPSNVLSDSLVDLQARLRKEGR
jgi:hypothetical protein